MSRTAWETKADAAPPGQPRRVERIMVDRRENGWDVEIELSGGEAGSKNYPDYVVEDESLEEALRRALFWATQAVAP